MPELGRNLDLQPLGVQARGEVSVIVATPEATMLPFAGLPVSPLSDSVAVEPKQALRRLIAK